MHASQKSFELTTRTCAHTIKAHLRNHAMLTSMSHRLLIAGCMLLSAYTVQAAPNEAAWPIVGQQGLVRFVIVPQSDARERDAYVAQIKKLCEPERTCFLNFYTNSTNAALSVPLPDAIDHEATAVFRRSSKQGAERFQWSCRLQVSTDPCF
jgi:hypothetical protein